MLAFFAGLCWLARPSTGLGLYGALAVLLLACLLLTELLPLLLGLLLPRELLRGGTPSPLVSC